MLRTEILISLRVLISYRRGDTGQWIISGTKPSYLIQTLPLVYLPQKVIIHLIIILESLLTLKTECAVKWQAHKYNKSKYSESTLCGNINHDDRHILDTGK